MGFIPTPWVIGNALVACISLLLPLDADAFTTSGTHLIQYQLLPFLRLSRHDLLLESPHVQKQVMP